MIDKILCICGTGLIMSGIFNCTTDNEIRSRSVFNILLGVVDIVVAFI